MSDPRYPIGRFSAPAEYTPELRARFIEELAAHPARLRRAVAGLSEPQLDTPYREGGWTVRQVVHHMADANMNGYIRCKLAVTADAPSITPYDEDRWAATADGGSAPVEWSLSLLEPLHARWVVFLRSLSDADGARAFVHAVTGPTTVDKAMALYAWHGNHHIAHITELRQRMGW